MEHEQNLSRLPIPTVLLDMVRTSLSDLIPHVPKLSVLLTAPLSLAFHAVQVDGTVLHLTAPRPTS